MVLLNLLTGDRIFFVFLRVRDTIVHLKSCFYTVIYQLIRYSL